MERTRSFLLLLCVSWTWCTLAFQSPRSPNNKRHIARPPSDAPTALRAQKSSQSSRRSRRERTLDKLERLFVGEGAENTFEKRQRTRDRIEDLQDEDFLLADVKPKALLHERDFFRQATRLEAWDQYVVVSILLTSISFGALQSFRLNPDHEGIFFYETVLEIVIKAVAGLSVLCALYSTMVFSLSNLYGKTALGLEQDSQYDEFVENTQDIRVKGFRAFSLAMALFAITVVLVLAEDLPLVMHLPVGAVMLGALYVGFRDWKVLVDNATDIFNYLEDY